jgi:hypothetical protein
VVADIYQITSADLLQANVTIITGILILLTVSIIYKKGSPAAIILTAFSPIMFVVSTILLVGASLPNYNGDVLFGWAQITFLSALCYLLMSILLTMIILKKHSNEVEQSS